MRLASRRDRGSATAEWAIALPAVVLVIAAALMGIAAVVHQSRLDQVAADAARRASLGQPHSSLVAHVHSVVGADVLVTVQIDEPGHTVCVHLNGSVPLGLVPDDVITLESVSCALRENS